MAVTGSTLVTLNNLSYYDSRLKKWVGENLEDSLFAMTDSTTYKAMVDLEQIDDKFLYFLTDTGEIYKSGICFGKETDLSDYMTQDEITEAISQAVNSLSTFDKKIVDTLPPNPDTNILYLIKDNTAKGEDKYKEYIVINGELTLIGSTSTDLTDYYTKTQTDQMVQQLATHIGSVDDGTVGCIWLA